MYQSSPPQEKSSGPRMPPLLQPPPLLQKPQPSVSAQASQVKSEAHEVSVVHSTIDGRQSEHEPADGPDASPAMHRLSKAQKPHPPVVLHVPQSVMLAQSTIASPVEHIPSMHRKPGPHSLLLPVTQRRPAAVGSQIPRMVSHANHPQHSKESVQGPSFGAQQPSRNGSSLGRSSSKTLEQSRPAQHPVPQRSRESSHPIISATHVPPWQEVPTEH